MDLEHINAELEKWEAAFVAKLGQSECTCGGCLRALDELAQQQTVTVKLIAKHIAQSFAGLEALMLAVDRNSAAIIALQERVRVLDEFAAKSLAGDPSLGGLSARVAALENQLRGRSGHKPG